MASETPKQGQIGSYSKDPNQYQGHSQEDDSNDEEKKVKKDMYGIRMRKTKMNLQERLL